MPLTLPNIISLVRVILSPVFAVLFLQGSRRAVALSIAVFAVAAITDYLDGWAARKLKKKTAWGGFFDPLADKVLTITAFFVLSVAGFFPLWMSIVVAVRDIITTLVRVANGAAAESHGGVVTSRSAKWKTAAQMTLINVALATALFSMGTTEAEHAFVAAVRSLDVLYWGMLAVTVHTVWTGIEYVVRYKSALLRLLAGKARAR